MSDVNEEVTDWTVYQCLSDVSDEVTDWSVYQCPSDVNREVLLQVLMQLVLVE